MQLSDLIALAAALRPPPGPEIPALAKSPNNVTGLPIGRAALNAPELSSPAQMLGGMLGAAMLPTQMAQGQALADALKAAAEPAPPMFGGTGVPMPLAPPVAPVAAGGGGNPFGLPEGPLPRIADAFWKIESGRSMNGDLTSRAGALGPMQIMPSTGAQYGAGDQMLRDAGTNLKVGGAIVGDLSKKYGLDPEAIAVAYNAGPRTADRWLGAGRDSSVLPTETQNYLAKLRQELSLPIASSAGGPPPSAASGAPLPMVPNLAPQFSPEYLAWAQQQDRINTLLGRRNPVTVDEALKLQFAPMQKQIELGFAGPTAYATAAGKFPVEAELQRLNSQNQMREHMATTFGGIIDPNNLAAGVTPIPGYQPLIAGNEAAKAGGALPAELTKQAMRPQTISPTDTLAVPGLMGRAQGTAGATSVGGNAAPATAQQQPMALPDLTAPPPGVIRMGMTPEQEKARQAVTADAEIAAKNRATFLNIAAAAPNITQGAMAEPTQLAAQYLRLIDPAFDKQVASYEDFRKNAETLVRELTRASDAQPAAIQLKMTRDSLPSPSTSPQGLRRVTNELIGAADYQIARNKALGLYDTQSARPGEFPQWWASHFSPYAFMIARMDPADRHDVLSKLSTTLTGRSELASLAKQFDLLGQLGIHDAESIGAARGDIAVAQDMPKGATAFRVLNGTPYYEIGGKWYQR